MYKLVIVWKNGDRDFYYYDNQEKAEKVERGFFTAFGNQIQWATVYKV